jgi:hypothetical protein
MSEEFGKMKCKTIRNKVLINNTFYFSSFENTIQQSEHHTVQ